MGAMDDKKLPIYLASYARQKVECSLQSRLFSGRVDQEVQLVELVVSFYILYVSRL